MSGPLSSEEIEDVVSSVRRLVSNELNAQRASGQPPVDRLLLTPALRVVSEARPLTPLILDHPEAEPISLETADVPASEEVEPHSDAADEVELVEATWEDEIWTSREDAPLGEVALGADVAEEVPAPVETEPQTGDVGQDDGTQPWAQIGPEWTEDEPIPFIPLRRRAEHLAARLAASRTHEPDETDESDQDDTPPEPLRDVAPELLDDDPLAADLDGDAPVARGIEDDAPGTAQRMPTEILDADGTPLAVLDEAALQEIVRQMIREELQGALGERITRNVRKLVRAEINRALVARDLD